MSSAKADAQLSNAVLGTMPVPTNATLKTTSLIVAAPPSTKAPSTTELSETLKAGATPAFINDSNFMADRRKAKLRVPRQLVHPCRDGAFQAGNAPYGAKRIATDIERPLTIIWKNSEVSKQSMKNDFKHIVEVLRRVEIDDLRIGLTERFGLILS
jgi:ribonuclease inhibitor